ncbi:MAG UNVERIFIED_CONTAM: hypothetical protein LVR18_12920 [Planctomycetaceae bacterium]
MTAATAETAAAHAEAAAAAASASGQPAAPPAPILQDTFQQPSPVWKALSGDWQWKDGVLKETAVTSFATITAEPVLPRNFEATVRWRTLQPGSYRSVGFSFDYLNPGDSQDVYTSTGDAAQTIQAFHRLNGQQQYPAAGIVSTSLKVGEETRVDITVRDQQLIIRLNGEQKLDYVMPTPRREGRFALWVHQGSRRVSRSQRQTSGSHTRQPSQCRPATAGCSPSGCGSRRNGRRRPGCSSKPAGCRKRPQSRSARHQITAARHRCRPREKQAAIAAARTELVSAQNLLEETLLACPDTSLPNTASPDTASPVTASPDTPAVATARKKVAEILAPYRHTRNTARFRCR